MIMNLSNKTTSKFSLETAADLDHLGEIIGFTEKTLERLGVPDDARGHLCLAVDEIVTNVALYAYKGTRGKINVSFERMGSKLIVAIADSGIAFNPLQHPAPDTSLSIDQRKIGGLGIHLVRKMTDKMEYMRVGDENRLILEKNIGGKK